MSRHEERFGAGVAERDRVGWGEGGGPVDGGEVLLRVDGTRLVAGEGTGVTLRGVGLGGWMNMENFITGYPSTESLQRKALRKALGPEGYKRFFDRFLTAFFNEEDAKL